MSTRERAASERDPLDDGRRNGTEHWRDVAGVSFCHWDRWLLRLALDEPNGLRSVVNTFQQRARRPGRADTDAEAMLAQLADLEARLAQVGCEPAHVLDDVDRSSTWLHDKAFKRILHGRPIHRTAAMARTPRNVLETRAREGNWAAWPASPAPYLTRLRPIYQHLYVDWRGVGSVSRSRGSSASCASATTTRFVKAMVTRASSARRLTRTSTKCWSQRHRRRRRQHGHTVRVLRRLCRERGTCVVSAVDSDDRRQLGETVETLKFVVRFPELSVAGADIAAAELQKDLLNIELTINVTLQQDAPENQSFGGTLVAVIDTAAVLAVARGIAAWLYRRGHKDAVEFEVRGEKVRFKAAGSIDDNAVKIVEVLSRRRAK